MTLQQALDHAIRLHQSGQFAEAVAIYRQILAVEPNHADALHLLGLEADHSGRYDEAVDLIGRAIAIHPEAPIFHYNLGVALRHRGSISEAIKSFRTSIDKEPTRPESWNNIGEALQFRGMLDDAITAFQEAVKLRPDFAEAHNNLGNALNERGDYQAAELSIIQALNLRSDYAAAHYNLGVSLLIRGDFEQGWEELEWRQWAAEIAGFHQTFFKPEWHGLAESLEGKRILLHAEQGLGDAIQFMRYIPLVHKLGGRIVLQCEPELHALARRFPSIDQVVSRNDPLPEFDLHCPLLSLPQCFGTTIGKIPAEIPYLHTDETKKQLWKDRFATLTQLKVGLIWAGNPRHPRDRYRSLAFSTLSPLVEINGVEYVSLQKGEAAKQIADTPMKLHSFDLNDMDDTAALIDNLDLVISVDTSVAHLAGAMGTPIWVLLPFVPDWRWMLNRADSPWYPTMRLFRQPSRGDWNTPIKQVAAALKEMA